MQIIIRKMTLTDIICNNFYKVRFWFYRNLRKKKLKNISPAAKDGLELTFEDEFTQKSWGKASEHKKWVIGEGWGMFHPDKKTVYYGEPTLNLDSTASFTVKYNPKTFPDDHRTGNPITIPFEVSLLSTQKSFKQQYGRFECRCTIPFDPGVWPAFWLWGSTWPPEFDIFELYGNLDGKTAGKQCINLHYGHDSDNTRGSRGWHLWIERKPKKSGPPKFHEFVVEWGPDKIEMFTDGIKIFRFTNKKIIKYYNVELAQQWIVVNHSLQEKYGGKQRNDYVPIKDGEFQYPDDYYSEFFVDYVRAYKNKD